MIYHKIMLKFVTITVIWRNILIVINFFKVFYHKTIRQCTNLFLNIRVLYDLAWTRSSSY